MCNPRALLCKPNMLTEFFPCHLLCTVNLPILALDQTSPPYLTNDDSTIIHHSTQLHGCHPLCALESLQDTLTTYGLLWQDYNHKVPVILHNNLQ